MSKSIKAVIGTEIHRFTLSEPITYEELQVELRNLSQKSSLSECELFYLDEDNDKISVSSTAELEEAFRVVQGTVLKVHVVGWSVVEPNAVEAEASEPESEEDFINVSVGSPSPLSSSVEIEDVTQDESSYSSNTAPLSPDSSTILEPVVSEVVVEVEAVEAPLQANNTETTEAQEDVDYPQTEVKEPVKEEVEDEEKFTLSPEELRHAALTLISDPKAREVLPPAMKAALKVLITVAKEHHTLPEWYRASDKDDHSLADVVLDAFLSFDKDLIHHPSIQVLLPMMDDVLPKLSMFIKHSNPSTLQIMETLIDTFTFDPEHLLMAIPMLFNPHSSPSWPESIDLGSFGGLNPEILRDVMANIPQNNGDGPCFDFCVQNPPSQEKEIPAEEEGVVVHEGVVCDICEAHPIEGIRYKCAVCGDFDMCEKCESVPGNHPQDHALLKYRQPRVVHHHVTCDGCGMSPISGNRFKCTDCDDFDLCSTCETQGDKHDKDHVMMKMKKAVRRGRCGGGRRGPPRCGEGRRGPPPHAHNPFQGGPHNPFQGGPHNPFQGGPNHHGPPGPFPHSFGFPPQGPPPMFYAHMFGNPQQAQPAEPKKAENKAEKKVVKQHLKQCKQETKILKQCMKDKKAEFKKMKKCMKQARKYGSVNDPSVYYPDHDVPDHESEHASDNEVPDLVDADLFDAELVQDAAVVHKFAEEEEKYDEPDAQNFSAVEAKVKAEQSLQEAKQAKVMQEAKARQAKAEQSLQEAKAKQAKVMQEAKARQAKRVAKQEAKPEEAKPEEAKPEEEDRRPKLPLGMLHNLVSKFTSMASGQDAATPAATPEFQACFVRDQNPDFGRVEPARIIFKTWQVKNTGKAWPVGSKLVYVRGDEIHLQEDFDVPLANEGEEVNVSAVVQAPDAPGTYQATFQMARPDRTVFGDRLLVSVNVGDPAPAPAPAPAPVVEEPVFVQPPVVQEPVPMAPVQVSPTAPPPMHSIPVAVPVTYSEQQKLLASMGFEGPVVVKVLAKHNGNLRLVINDLLTMQ